MTRPPADFSLGERPCGATDRDSNECQILVPTTEGYQYCRAGHLSICSSIRIPDTAWVTAQLVWFAHNIASNSTTQFCATARPDGSVKVSRRKTRLRTDLKYGVEPLERRAIVFTHYAARQVEEDGLSEADVRSVFENGLLFQNQPGRFRYRGLSVAGRPMHVVFRLNERHEAVVIAAFTEKESHSIEHFDLAEAS